MEKPIIFSTNMVRAILAGRKTQTRRAIKPQPASGIRKSVFVKTGLEDGHGKEIKIPYQPGDTLWVRETWRSTGVQIQPYAYFASDGDLILAGEDGDILTLKYKWKPSIHMPKSAARIWLEVTAVRVERVQDIAYEDCIREGMWDYGTEVDTLAAFQGLWQTINAKRGFGWETNPFCWVISFEVIKKGC